MTGSKFSYMCIPLAALAFCSGAFAQTPSKQVVTGPQAVYWLGADTVSGYGAMGRGMSLGALMQGGGSTTQRSLSLYLGSRKAAPSSPDANHFVPAGLKVGPSLPLLSPDKAKVTPMEAGPGRDMPDEPGGRLLLYWGCGETARPDQPVIFDYRKPGAKPADLFAGVGFKGLQPPTSDRYEGFGEWPNRKSTKSIPATGSLVGDHAIKANYAPEINFKLTATQDFLAPLQPTRKRLSSNAILLKWPAIANASAYFASIMSSNDKRDTIIWTSSDRRMMMMGMPPYLGAAEIKQLLTQKVLLSPQQTECTVPHEVVKATEKGGMLMMHAFGQEADFAFPPRPADPKVRWDIAWTAKALSKASYMGMLDGEDAGGDADADASEQPSSDADQTAPTQKKKKRSLFDRIGDFPL